MSFLGIIASAYNSSGPSPDTNLAWNNASDGFWYKQLPFPPSGQGLTVNINSAGTVTSADASYGNGPTAWYTGTPTGSNFEVKATFTSSAGPGTSTVLVGPSGSQTAITYGNTSAWYNLGSNILLTVNQLTGSVEDIVGLTVVIRQVAVTSNSISRLIEFDWFA